MIFVSCGQFTQAEKNLGKSICELVRAVTDMKTFFAEEVQDLIGLDTNILQHLREAAGFITVLHPRGIIIRPDGSHLIRASVWIEQEIAIATYIQQMERHPLPVIAFVHKSVTLEGIRTLLNLNPIVFEHEQEVLAALPARLQAWKTLKPAGISIKVKSINYRSDRDHFVSDLVFSIVNDTDKRIKEFNCEIRIPAVLLQHENYYYGDILIQSNDPRYKVFRINEKMTGLIEPRLY